MRPPAQTRFDRVRPISRERARGDTSTARDRSSSKSTPAAAPKSPSRTPHTYQRDVGKRIRRAKPTELAPKCVSLGNSSGFVAALSVCQFRSSAFPDALRGMAQ
jgi:hypothetical protein